jgi:hypothetical protein
LDGRRNSHEFEIAPKTAVKFKREAKKNCSNKPGTVWYETNIRIVMAMQSLGKGGRDAAMLLAMLDLPGGNSIADNYQMIESKIGKIERDVTDKLLDQQLQEEIRVTYESEGKSYSEWVNKPVSEREKARLTVSFDMGWQKRACGCQYNSLSGHAFIVGARTKKVIGVHVSCKMCLTCRRSEKKGKIVKAHECSKNFTGSSKAMESNALLELAKQAFTRGFVVSCVVGDDNSTIRATMHHSWNDLVSVGRMDVNDWPRDKNGRKKTDTGKLPLHLPEPTFLADPTHCVRVLASHIFGLKNIAKKKVGCTDFDCNRLKLYFGAM